MSHVNIDPDCVGDMGAVAEACGISVSAVCGGLVLFWFDCGQWSEPMAEAKLRAFFGGADICLALESHGFIERVDTGWKANPAKGHFVCEGGEA